MSRVLFVCHANMLRSVSAEYLARWLIGAPTHHGDNDGPSGPTGETVTTALDPIGWSFASAGVRALPRHTADADAAAALRDRGIDSSPHRARQLTARMLQSADLTLTFDSSQRAFALRESPRAARSVLTIRRAARLLAGAKPSGGDETTWHQQLASPEPYGPDDDFADPVGTGQASVAAAVDEIESLLRVILPALGATVVR